MPQTDLRYLATAEPGLRWMRSHCRRNTQLNVARAVEALRRAEAVLRPHPESGHRYEDIEAVREAKIPGTAFSLLYTIACGTVWIIDVRDRRGLRSADALRAFAVELRTRMKE